MLLFSKSSSGKPKTQKKSVCTKDDTQRKCVKSKVLEELYRLTGVGNYIVRIGGSRFVSRYGFNCRWESRQKALEAVYWAAEQLLWEEQVRNILTIKDIRGIIDELVKEGEIEIFRKKKHTIL